jgi:hypothetical protein
VDHGDTRPPFFPVSVSKFAVMSLCSFGSYHITWIYWSWRCEKERSGEDLSPFWRTFFTPVWLPALLARVKQTAGETQVPANWSAVVISAVTILLWLSALLPAPWSLISAFAFVPSLPVQASINAINGRLSPGSPRNNGYSGANIALVVIGGLLITLMILGLTLAPPELPPGTVSV